MTHVDGRAVNETAGKYERRSRVRTQDRSALISKISYHGLPLGIVFLATLVLFRTWISGRVPGGTDSGFLYSQMVFYRDHGLQFFTIWLPTPFGQVSQYSVYWLLSMLMTVFRAALTTYDLAAVSISLVSGFGMYAVAWSWSRSRLGSLAAAILYSFSPLSVGQWLSGHLDVQISMALGPLMVWSIVRVLDTGSKRAAVGLGLCATALLLLTTGQAAYWILPTLIVIIGKLLLGIRDIVPILRRAVPGAILALAVFAIASTVQFLPWIFGARAAFVGAQNLAIEALSIHAKYSLPFGKNIIGVPWETWLPLGSKLSLVSFGSVLYIVPQAGIVVLAALSTLTRKGWFCVLLLISAVAAWLIASGPYGPVGHYYTLLWQHVSYFRELRVANRWLMISSFSVASMLAVSIGAATSWGFGRFGPGRSGDPASGQDTLDAGSGADLHQPQRGTGPKRKTLRALFEAGVLVVAAGLLLALNAGTIFARGLPTISPPRAYVRAYSAMAITPGDWRVLTVPLGQSWMGGPAYGDTQGMAADLGVMSPFYDGHSVVANGGWDPRASQFANFLYDLVNQGSDRHLAGLLGAAGVKYVVIDPEPAVAAPLGQARFMKSQEGLKQVTSGHGVTVLENPQWQPQVTQPRSSCVIAGGYPVVEDLTENPSFSFKDTALYFADQVISTSGWPALIHMVNENHCLILGPGAEGELAVLRNSAASAQAISLAPATWPSGPIDPLMDSQGDSANWVGVPPGGRLSWKPTVNTAGAYRVWIRVLRQPGAASVPVSVNGRPAGSVAPALPATVGFQWLPAGLVRLNAGRVSVAITGASQGISPEIAEIALVRGDTTMGVPSGIQPNWLVQDVDALDASLYGRPSVKWSKPLTKGEWHPTSGVRATHGSRDTVTLTPVATSRPGYSVATVRLAGALNPSEPLVLKFRGTGSGSTYYLNIFFKHGVQKSFEFQDVTRGTQLLYFTPQQGKPAWRPVHRHSAQYQYFSSHTQLQVPNWSQAKRLSLSANSRVWPGGALQIGGPYAVRLSHPLPYFAGKLPTAEVTPTPRQGARLLTPMVSTTAQMRDVRPGIINFSQAYDPQWRLSGTRAGTHTVALGFENSYFGEKGARQATVSYSLARIGEIGTVVSLIAWFGGLGSLIIWPYVGDRWRRRSKGHRGRSFPDGERASPR